MRKKKGLIFVISGPSGSGKTTLIKHLLTDRGLKKILVKSVSLTTREKRPGEKEGRDYFFVTEKRFKDLLKRKKLIEWTRYLDYYYATPKSYVEEQVKRGKNIALCLDTRGAREVRRVYPKNTVTIFVLPPKIEILEERMRLRSQKLKEKDLLMRLNLAGREISKAGRYDYRIVNEDLEPALRKLKEIIVRKIGS